VGDKLQRSWPGWRTYQIAVLYIDWGNTRNKIRYRTSLWASIHEITAWALVESVDSTQHYTVSTLCTQHHSTSAELLWLCALYRTLDLIGGTRLKVKCCIVTKLYRSSPYISKATSWGSHKTLWLFFTGSRTISLRVNSFALGLTCQANYYWTSSSHQTPSYFSTPYSFCENGTTSLGDQGGSVPYWFPSTQLFTSFSF
jgi:hypothetical protein